MEHHVNELVSPSPFKVAVFEVLLILFALHFNVFDAKHVKDMIWCNLIECHTLGLIQLFLGFVVVELHYELLCKIEQHIFYIWQLLIRHYHLFTEQIVVELLGPVV